MSSRHRKDNAIRRKIESDLNKRKSSVPRPPRKTKTTPGTVLSLRPSEPIICKPTTTVHEVAQLMTARRENCILVVDDGNLVGIFTAKDLAFRIVGSGLKATVTIDQIMTPNPLCANASSPASEALSMMVEKGFRHLPVLDDNGQIVGVLDITKCYAQQMEKLERLHASSKKLYEALDSVNMEISHEQPQHVFQYFEDLRAKMSGPTLENVLEASTVPVYTNVRASVYEATVLMKENKTTAVLVKDLSGDVTGIFTSKDVVLRVIATGLDPKKCSIVRVMTPQPDVAPVSLPIQQALRQMFEGHYLNLPVVGDDHSIIGMVDVLKLTHATLAQIKQIEEKSEAPEGPAWNKFWTSLDDSTSVHSDSITESAPEITPSEFQAFNVDIGPQDSISHVGRDDAFTFKFRSPNSARVHRISVRAGDGLERLRELIEEKLNHQDYVALGAEKGEYAISYVDDEGDMVSITSDHDLEECVRINRGLGRSKGDLYVHNEKEGVRGVKMEVWLGVGVGIAVLGLAVAFLRRK